MSKKKLLLAILALAFVFAVPVYAAQTKNQNANARAAEQAEAPVYNGVAGYVRNELESMGTKSASEKEAATEAILERLRERVEAMVQNAIRRYEQVQTQVKNAEGLTDAEKEAVQARIMTQIQAMNTIRTQLREADTVQEMKQVMAQVKTRFKFSLGEVRQAVKGVFKARLEKILTNLTTVYGKLETKVSALSDGDTKTELEALLAEAQASLTSAKTNIEAGELEAAKADLVNAHKVLVEVVGGLK